MGLQILGHGQNMTLPMVHETPLAQARAPFRFNSAAHLMMIGRERANNLTELLAGLRSCPDDSIFQHTFRTLPEYHFIRQVFSNDFAYWSSDECRETALAERLAGLDVRSFTSVSELRETLVDVVESYLRRNPSLGDRPARKPFYFCAANTVVMPTDFIVANLGEFADALKRVTIHSIHYHFIEVRLRLKLRSNDFSIWLEEDLEMPKLAAQLNRIDIYNSTLDGVRENIVRIVEGALSGRKSH